MAEASRALAAVAAGQSGSIPGPSTGPTALVDAGPQTPSRPEVDPMTVRTWQGQPHHMPPPTPPRPYQVGPGTGRPGGPQGYPAAPGAPAWRGRLLAALAIVVAALIGILVANAFVDRSGAAASLSSLNSTSTNTPDPSIADQPLPTALPTQATATSQTVTQTVTDAPPAGMNATPTFPVMNGTVHTYFGFLPDQPAQAFALLTANEQNAGGGLAGYEHTWSTVKSVQVGVVLPHGTNQVVAMVRLVLKNGQKSDGAYILGFVAQNGTTLIDSIALTGKPNRHG